MPDPVQTRAPVGAVVLVLIHPHAAGQGEGVGQRPLIFHEHGPAPAGQLIGAVGHVELVALILQILVAVLAAHAQIVSPSSNWVWVSAMVLMSFI